MTTIALPFVGRLAVPRLEVLVPLVVVGGAGLAWYLRHGPSGVWTDSGGTELSKDQNKAIVLGLFRAAGYSDKIAKAAWVNAMAESNGSNVAVGDGGKSIGLFQLADFGAGKGMTKAERFDPAKNTARIIQEVEDYGKDLIDKADEGGTVAELAAIFSRDIERPADTVGEMERRRKLAAKLFPGE